MVHGTYFAQKEPTWKALLQKPKKTKTVCVYLHIGTDAPSGHLLDFLSKLGWLGVCIGPHPPPAGNEDTVQYTRIDPAAWEDQSQIDALTSPTGGLVAKPAHFGLTYVYVTFNAREDAWLIDPYDDDYEKKKKERQQKQKQEEGMTQEQKMSKADAIPPKTTLAEGYGKVGITRGERVRRRLRALRNSLNVAVHRMANDGSMIVFWPGLPVHPVLYFIVASLRKIFTRVHVLSPEGSKTFDIYILAIGFNRQKAEDSTPGLGGLELRSFFDNSFRTDTMDDVLLWTLMPPEEEDEVSVGADGRGMIASYGGLYKTWTEKCRALAMDLGVVILADGQVAEKPQLLALPKKEGKAKASPKKTPAKKKGSDSGTPEGSKEPAANPTPEGAGSKEEADPEEKKEAPQEPPKAQEEPKEKKEKAKPQEKKEPKKSSKATAAPDQTKPPKPASRNSSKEGKKDEKDKTRKASNEKPTEDALEEEAEQEDGEEKEPTGSEAKLLGVDPLLDFQPKKKLFKLSRSLPYLSGSLGAAPGHKLQHPNYEILAQQYKLVDTALSVAQNGRMLRWDLDKKDKGGLQLDDITALPTAEKTKKPSATPQPATTSMFGGPGSPLRATRSGGVFRSTK